MARVPHIAFVVAALSFVLAACSSSSDTPSRGNSSPDTGAGASPDSGRGAEPDAGIAMDGGSCNPACTGRTCGPDSCGGECGTCGEHASCDDTTGQCTPQLCPPSGPFGTGVGETIPNLIFSDCDGNTHALHDLCESKASYFFIFAGW